MGRPLGKVVDVHPAPTLPLLRWAGALGTLHTGDQLGAVVSVGDPLLTAIASLLFQLSGLIWSALANLVQAAEGAGTTQLPVSWIDPIYRRIGAGLIGTTSTSLVVLTVVAGAGLVAYQAYRQGSGVGGALRGLAGVLLPISLLVVTVDASAGGGEAPGSPAWAVAAVSGWTSAATGSMAALFERFGPVGSVGIDGGQDEGMADCAKYLQGLDDAYVAGHHVPGGGPAALQDANAVVVSDLWESTVLAPWVQAQFGPGPLGQKTFCHLLDIEAGVPAGDQIGAMAADTSGGPYSTTTGPTWSQVVGAGGVAPGDVRPGHPRYATLLGPDFAGGNDDLQRTMVGWAACDYVGSAAGNVDGWRLDPAFAHVSDPPATTASCADWWDQGTTEPPPHDGAAEVDGPFDFEDDQSVVQATTANGVDAAEARSYLEGLSGHDAGGALSASVAALGSSVTYGWALGGLALGVLIGRISLALVLAGMPIVLLLAAIPSPDSRRIAARAARLGVASLLSTSACSLLLGLLLSIIGLFQAGTGRVFADPGAAGALLQALVPLAAVLVARRLLRAVHLDGTLSWRGTVPASLGVARAAITGGGPAWPHQPLPAGRRRSLGRPGRAEPPPAPGPRPRRAPAALDTGPLTLALPAAPRPALGRAPIHRGGGTLNRLERPAPSGSTPRRDGAADSSTMPPPAGSLGLRSATAGARHPAGPAMPHPADAIVVAARSVEPFPDGEGTTLADDAGGNVKQAETGTCSG